MSRFTKRFEFVIIRFHVLEQTRFDSKEIFSDLNSWKKRENNDEIGNSIHFLYEKERLNLIASASAAPFSSAQFCWPFPTNEYRQPNSVELYPWCQHRREKSEKTTNFFIFRGQKNTRKIFRDAKAHLTINFNARNNRNKVLCFLCSRARAAMSEWTIDK